MAGSTTADDHGDELSRKPSHPHSHHSHHSHHGHHGHHNHSNNSTSNSTSSNHHVSPKQQNAAAATVEYGYPRGHLGHLNEAESEAFAEFKAYLTEKGLYQPGPPPSHDDPTLLRFLRARRWVVEEAYKQFKDTEDWRAANHLNVLYDTIDLEAYEQSRRLYPQWTGRRDKRGIPVYLFEIRHLDSKTISAYEKTANNTYSRAQSDGKTSPRLLRLFALYENLTRFAQPLCTEMPDRPHAATTPITLSTNIVDVSGVSLRQFWYLKSHMQAASTLATAHYPETLDRIFIIGAPMFFSTVWGWIKRWFDPVTVSKIFILSHSEVLPTLLSFVDIEHIPRSYGGELDFAWGEMPNLDPRIDERLTWANGHTSFPVGPLYWRPIDGGDRLECVAVGSVDQVERMERVCTMPKFYKGVPAVVPEEVAAAAAAEAAAAEAVEVAEAETTAAAADATATAAIDATAEGTTKAPATDAPTNDADEAPVAAVQNLSLSEKVEEANGAEPADAPPARTAS
ncbi:cellular retinaldehyde-binding/triple function protein [Niveomyces insectorum RCEF 264]|uniref:Cellular retinaldehyde-binding/triple function protein n=1 Tax=Niveomyces insectorum RCEF 264 TaxID=1081102 RepID=A0A167YYV2_9HYPO|nr:cellular retinaldehyde-binding/triple function protein [Niveomyces insectorum RCEF 264]